MVEDECWYFFVEDFFSRFKVYYLDFGEGFLFIFCVIIKGIIDENFLKFLLRVYIGNILLFYVELLYYYFNMNYILEVILIKRFFISGIFLISVKLY